MCTDPELSKRFREVKTDELTWERLRGVAETYERATASDARAMMVNSKSRFGKRNQGTQGTGIKTCYRCNKKGHISKECRTNKESSIAIASSAKPKDTHPMLARNKKQRAMVTKNLATRIKHDIYWIPQLQTSRTTNPTTTK